MRRDKTHIPSDEALIGSGKIAAYDIAVQR